MRHASLAIFHTLLAPLEAFAAVGPWQSHPEVQVRLISPWEVAPQTPRELRLGVEVTLAPHWHSYWKNSGDAGFAPALVLKTPQIEGAELLFPAPRRFELRGGLVAFGYEDRMIYPVRAALVRESAATVPDRLEIRGSFDYVVCAEECVPYRDTLTLEQSIAATGDASREDASAATSLRIFEEQLPKPATAVALGTSATLRELADGSRSLELVLGAPSDPTAMLFLLPDPAYQAGRPERGLEGGHTRFRVQLTPRTAPPPPLAATEIHWTATGLLLGGTATAVDGTTTAQPAQRSAFPGIVLWPLAGALVVAFAVWAFSRAGTRQTTG